MIRSLWRHRSLAWALMLREITARYRGSMLGLLWSFVNPLLMLVVYTFVFSVVFKARWVVGEGGTGSEGVQSSVASGSRTEFALILLAGLMVYSFFAECINRAPNLIVTHANYVKKVVFPLEILPWVALGSALFNLSIQLLVWLIAYTFLFGWPHLTTLWLPLIWLPLVFLTLGLSWLLASLGVYVRDTSQAVIVITGTMMFLTPIFYPASALPVEFQTWIYANPLTPVIEMTRKALYWGMPLDWQLWAIHLVFSLVIAVGGYTWFQKTRKGFADVL